MTTHLFDKTDKGREEIATRKYHLAPRLRTMLLLFDGKKSSEQVLQKVAGLGVGEPAIAELLEQGFIHESDVSPVAGGVEPVLEKKVGAVLAATVEPTAATTVTPSVEPAIEPRVEPVPQPVVLPAVTPTVDVVTQPGAAPVSIPIVAPPTAAAPAFAAPAPVAASPATLAPQVDAPAVMSSPAASEPRPAAASVAAATPVREVDPQFQSVYQFFHETIKKTIGQRGFALQLKVERVKTVDEFRKLRDEYIAAVLNAHGPDVAREIGARLDLLLKPKA